MYSILVNVRCQVQLEEILLHLGQISSKTRTDWGSVAQGLCRSDLTNQFLSITQEIIC